MLCDRLMGSFEGLLNQEVLAVVGDLKVSLQGQPSYLVGEPPMTPIPAVGNISQVSALHTGGQPAHVTHCWAMQCPGEACVVKPTQSSTTAGSHL